MFTKKNVLLITLCLGAFALFAQPGEEIIDLGGEDTAVGPLKPPAISQVVEPAAWLTSLLRGDTLRLTTSGQQVGFFFAEVKDLPGPIDAYSTLNLFTFLTDQLAFQDYFMNRVYAVSSGFRTSGRTTPSSRQAVESTRNRAEIATGTRSREAGISRGRGNTTTFSREDRVALASYPLVRQYAAGRNGLTPNPRYLAKPSTSGTLDADYVAAYNKYTNLLALYRLALKDPALGEFEKHPATIPSYFFDFKRRGIAMEWERTYDKLEMAVKAKINEENARKFNGTLSPLTLARSDRHMATITAELSRTPMTSDQQELLRNTMKRNLRDIRSLRLAHQSLVSTYQSHYKLLSEQEKIWFRWILVNSTQIQETTSSVLEYLKQVTDLPLSSTNYSQLVAASDLLREARQLINNLPDEAKAYRVLNTITAYYFNQVEASKVSFHQLQQENER